MKLTEEQIEYEKQTITDRLSNGDKIEEIATYMGCSVSGVTQKIYRYNIDATALRKASPPLTQEDKEYISNLIFQGYSVNEVIQKLRLNKNSVQKYLKSSQHHMQVKKLNEKEREEKLVRLFTEGKTLAKIAGLCGITVPRVSALLRQAGILYKQLKSKESMDKYIELKEKGYTNKKIAELLGKSESWLYYASYRWPKE